MSGEEVELEDQEPVDQSGVSKRENTAEREKKNRGRR